MEAAQRIREDVPSPVRIRNEGARSRRKRPREVLQQPSAESKDEEVDRLVQERELCRQMRNFKRADEIREMLRDHGIKVDDRVRPAREVQHVPRILQERKDAPLLSFDDLETLRSVLAQEAVDGQQVSVRELLLDLRLEEHDKFWQKVHWATSKLLCRECILSGEAEHAVSAVATLLVNFTDHVVDVEKCMDLPPAFLLVARLCESVLVHIEDAEAQRSILTALEKICVDGFRGCEDFSSRVVSSLLERCAGPKMTSADVTRLYKVHTLLDELDWADESTRSVREAARRCVASSAFMRCKHGQDMLAVFYSIHPSFVVDVNGEVQKQVISCRAALIEKYAAGLYKGWKQAEGECKEEIESCLQQWGELAIKANHKAADVARAVLKNFHFCHLNDDATHELLCRIYGPVFWRSLKVANSQVRVNAVKLLQYVFPLAPKSAGVEQEELELAKEVQICREILEDPCEPVRRAAVSTVCTIIKNFWSFLPNHDVGDLLRILWEKCARDKKAATVRVAVAEGFALILQNSRTHQVMSGVLSQVAHLLHDRHPAVMRAFVDLVKFAGHCKVIDKDQVAPSEDLYLRLVCEHAEAQVECLQKGKATMMAASEKSNSPEAVVKHLASLLQKDVFPVNSDSLNNVASLIDTLPLGLFAVLRNLDDSIPVSECVKLAAFIFVQFVLKNLKDAGWSDGTPASKQEQLAAKSLQVVGLLLRRTMAEIKKQRREERQAADENGESISAEGKASSMLEDFVYQHFKEEEFLPLLCAADEESDGCLRLQHHFLSALSPLDPSRLPKTVKLARQQLLVACSGSSDFFEEYGAVAHPRLQELLHVGSSWRLLNEAIQPALENILAASAKLSQRKPISDDTLNVIAVMESAFRDPLVRSSLLRTRADQVCQMVKAVVSSFSKAWSGGILQLQKHKQDANHSILGPAADIWPRLLGLIVRIALHVQCRLPEQASALDAVGDTSSRERIADEALLEIAGTLTAEPSREVLRHLVAIAESRASDGPKKKKPRLSGAPSDLGSVLQVHRRLLEAFNAAALLAVSSASVAEGEQQPVSSVGANVMGGALIETLWQWSRIVDILQPQPEGSQLTETWRFAGRLVQQMMRGELLASQALAVAGQLLIQVSDEVPATDADLKTVLHALLFEMESDPQLHELLGRILAADDSSEAALADHEESRSALEVHKRVLDVTKSLVLSFRSLRTKFLPGIEDPKSVIDSRRSTAPPSRWLSSKLSDPPSPTRRSNTSHTPQRSLESLFNGCFEDEDAEPSTPKSQGSVGSAATWEVAGAGA